MSGIPLRFGLLQAAGFTVQRSGLTWVCEDGHLCRPNEVIAYCNISLEGVAGQHAVNPLGEERELQVAIAPRIAGRVRIVDTAIGGHLSVHGVRPWRADDIVGYLDPADQTPDPASNPSRLLILAGRRTTALASVETGLLGGWHNRSRAWWSDDDGASGPTLLSLGICDCNGPVRGERGAFTEIFEAAPFAAQIVYVPDQPLTPCAPVLAEQFTRTAEAFQAIAADLQSALVSAKTPANADDWLFAGTLLQALERSPIRETYSLLTPSGLQSAGPPDAILLSLNAEFQTVMRHKQLGYHLHIMRHYRAAAGPAIQAWLANAFEPVRREIADIKRDYERLFDLVADGTGGRFMIINRMSSSGQEDITSYAAFDGPMAQTLETVAAKELNLMLHELAETHDIDIIDVDALAGDYGAGLHLPDGIHQSGLIQDTLRGDILRNLA